ncbi:MAG: MCE family protein [Alphaproteobacteria bacterium]|nr:MCE family protein [Alphaproteobacteria bacterium]
MKITMEQKKIWVGFIFALLLGVWLIMVHERSALDQSHRGFTLYAFFNKTDGLNNGAEVRLGGMNVGRVVEQTFAEGYQIKVELALNKDYELPVDSSLQIETDGLMGAKHLEIVPGADDEILVDGDVIGYTQDVMVLNDLLDKVLAYMRDKKGVTDEEESN